MSLLRLLLIAALTLAAGLAALAQPPAAQKKRLLAIAQSKGFQHDAISYALGTIWKIGQESGVYDTFLRTDTELITKKKLPRNAKNLDYFDAVLFYTTGELDMDAEQKADLLSFIRDDGKGFIGVHSAPDTFYQWPEYGELIGGYFDGHPWNVFEAPIIVEDRDHPATRHLPRTLTVRDEIYPVRNFSRERVRVLMRLDETKLDYSVKGIKREDRDFAVTWVRRYGKGRVFYSSFGHVEATWDRPDIQKMWLEGIKWAMGLTEGDATPRPRPAD